MENTLYYSVFTQKKSVIPGIRGIWHAVCMLYKIVLAGDDTAVVSAFSKICFGRRDVMVLYNIYRARYPFARIVRNGKQ